MIIKLTTRQIGDVSVVDVAGGLTVEMGSRALHEAIRTLVNQDCTKVLLNLGEVTYVDSAGIGALVSAFTTVANKGGRLKLLNPPSRLKELLHLTRIYGIFDIHHSEEAALQSFA